MCGSASRPAAFPSAWRNANRMRQSESFNPSTSTLIGQGPSKREMASAAVCRTGETGSRRSRAISSLAAFDGVSPSRNATIPFARSNGFSLRKLLSLLLTMIVPPSLPHNQFPKHPPKYTLIQIFAQYSEGILKHLGNSQSHGRPQIRLQNIRQSLGNPPTSRQAL